MKLDVNVKKWLMSPRCPPKGLPPDINFRIGKPYQTETKIFMTCIKLRKGKYFFSNHMQLILGPATASKGIYLKKQNSD